MISTRLLGDAFGDTHTNTYLSRSWLYYAHDGLLGLILEASNANSVDKAGAASR